MSAIAAAGWTLAIVGFFTGLAFVAFTWFVFWQYGPHIVQVFQRRPFLLAEPPPPTGCAESVAFPSANGRMLRGAYIRHSAVRRRGVLLFCHEFSGDRWLWAPYLGSLTSEGFDVFTFDFCNHGESDSVPGYEPLHWVTEHETADVLAAVDYLARRPDADEFGVGLFGVSKGGGAGIAAAAGSPRIRAIVTDGAYPNHGTVIEYEERWVSIFSKVKVVYRLLPRWYYAILCELTLRKLSSAWNVRYARVERSLRRLADRPILMIHGGRDNYITRSIATRFFSQASGPDKEFWIVEGAKHNRCLEKAGDEYHRRVRDFFCRHLRAPETQRSHDPPKAEDAEASIHLLNIVREKAAS